MGSRSEELSAALLDIFFPFFLFVFFVVVVFVCLFVFGGLFLFVWGFFVVVFFRRYFLGFFPQWFISGKMTLNGNPQRLFHGCTTAHTKARTKSTPRPSGSCWVSLHEAPQRPRAGREPVAPRGKLGAVQGFAL